ncbi:unnamed protein product [Closterium sp. Naga37s-1]|nr:unnamed protein product [Closterium sp. Naga37s-1]
MGEKLLPVTTRAVTPRAASADPWGLLRWGKYCGNGGGDLLRAAFHILPFALLLALFAVSSNFVLGGFSQQPFRQSLIVPLSVSKMSSPATTSAAAAAAANLAAPAEGASSKFSGEEGSVFGGFADPAADRAELGESAQGAEVAEAESAKAELEGVSARKAEIKESSSKLSEESVADVTARKEKEKSTGRRAGKGKPEKRKEKEGRPSDTNERGIREAAVVGESASKEVSSNQSGSDNGSAFEASVFEAIFESPQNEGDSKNRLGGASLVATDEIRNESAVVEESQELSGGDVEAALTVKTPKEEASTGGETSTGEATTGATETVGEASAEGEASAVGGSSAGEEVQAETAKQQEDTLVKSAFVAVTEGDFPSRLGVLCAAPSVAAVLAARNAEEQDQTGQARAMAVVWRGGDDLFGGLPGREEIRRLLARRGSGDAGNQTELLQQQREEKEGAVDSWPELRLSDVETGDTGREGMVEIKVSLRPCRNGISNEPAGTIRLWVRDELAMTVASSGSLDLTSAESCSVRALETACLGGLRPSAGVAAIMRAHPASALSALPHSTAVYLERGAAAPGGHTCGGCRGNSLRDCTPSSAAETSPAAAESRAGEGKDASLGIEEERGEEGIGGGVERRLMSVMRRGRRLLGDGESVGGEGSGEEGKGEESGAVESGESAASEGEGSSASTRVSDGSPSGGSSTESSTEGSAESSKGEAESTSWEAVQAEMALSMLKAREESGEEKSSTESSRDDSESAEEQSTEAVQTEMALSMLKGREKSGEGEGGEGGGGKGGSGALSAEAPSAEAESTEAVTAEAVSAEALSAEAVQAEMVMGMLKGRVESGEWSCLQLQVAEAWVVSAAAALIHTRASLEARFLRAQATAGTARGILGLGEKGRAGERRLGERGSGGGGEGSGGGEEVSGEAGGVVALASANVAGLVPFKVHPSVCDSRAPTPFVNRRYLQQLLVDEQLKTVYCFVPKAGCTGWKVWFRQQQNRPNATDAWIAHDPKHSGLKLLAFDMQEREFSFVRNPYTRLPSAYLNKHVGGGPPHDHEYWNSRFFHNIAPYWQLLGLTCLTFLTPFNLPPCPPFPLFPPPSLLQVIQFLTRPDYFKFTFVRNPYTRLPSAYLNKHVGGGPPHDREYWNSRFFHNIAPYRQLLDRNNGSDLFDFPDFVELTWHMEKSRRSIMDAHIMPEVGAGLGVVDWVDLLDYVELMWHMERSKNGRVGCFEKYEHAVPLDTIM